MGETEPGPASDRNYRTRTRPRSAGRWWGGNADRGDTVRLEAFSDGVLAIAITLLILDVRVEQSGGEPLSASIAHAAPEIVAFAATFLQIGIMWANHHALFRIIARSDQLLLLVNLLLLGFISFLPLPTRLVAEHTHGGDAQTAMLLYGATLSSCAVAFNLLWLHALRSNLLVRELSSQLRREITVRYVLGLGGYVVATLLAFVQPWVTLAATALLALFFILGPEPRAAARPLEG